MPQTGVTLRAAITEATDRAAGPAELVLRTRVAIAECIEKRFPKGVASGSHVIHVVFVVGDFGSFVGYLSPDRVVREYFRVLLCPVPVFSDLDGDLR